MDYSGKFAEYYDRLYEKKDYDKEVDFIVSIINKELKYSGKIKLSDIGCGTGTHVLNLAKKYNNYNILGADKSEEMLKIANKKKEEEKLLSELNFDKDDIGFSPDVVISLFNVINHNETAYELHDFIYEIGNCFSTELFIFECWNKTAVLKDNPREEKRSHMCKDHVNIMTKTIPELDLFNSKLKLKMNVFSYWGDFYENFDHEINITLWDTKIINDILERSNFKIIDICKPFDQSVKYSDDLYKLMYICRRK